MEEYTDRLIGAMDALGQLIDDDKMWNMPHGIGWHLNIAWARLNHCLDLVSKMMDKLEDQE